MFHALTGCDTISSFKGTGKKSAWQAWQTFKEETEIFTFLTAHPFQHLNSESGLFQKIERLIVILYDKTSPLNSVNVRQERSSFAARAEAWTGYLLRRMHCFSIPNGQCTKLEYGQRAHKYNKSFHLHRI